MAQFKVYGHAEFLKPNAERVSAAVHTAAVGALGLPSGKRFHRFIALEEGMFFTPDDRSEQYLIIECVLFEGRSVETKTEFYRQLLVALNETVGIDAQDVEMTFIDTPRHNWLIRGKAGDELEVPYQIEK